MSPRRRSLSCALATLGVLTPLVCGIALPRAAAQEQGQVEDDTPAQQAEQPLPRGVLVGVGIQGPIPFPQSLGNYVQNEVDRDFRLSPAPGYYPYLQSRSNATGTTFSVELALEEYEIRYSYTALGWDEATVTHVSCTQVEVIEGNFDDATAEYLPVGENYCGDSTSSIEEEMGDELNRDLSLLELANLELHTLSAGMRSYLWRRHPFNVWIPWGGGAALATFSSANASLDFGLLAHVGVGASYELSNLFAFEVAARYQAMITTAPGDFQTNLNHAQATGGNIFSATFELLHLLSLQMGLRLNF